MDKLDKSIVIELAFALIESGVLREIVSDFIAGAPNLALGDKLNEALVQLLEMKSAALEKELA